MNIVDGEGDEPRRARPDWRGFGAELRGLRERHGLDVRGLARVVGCSAATVSRMERGLTAPTPEMIELVAREFDVSVEQLLDPLRSGSPPPPVPAAVALEVASSGAGDVIELESGLRWRMLPSGGDGAIEFREVSYPPGSAGDAVEAIRHSGCEYGYVIHGRVGLEHGEETRILSTGDAVALDASRPHRTWNAGTTPAKAVWLSRLSVAG